LLRLPLHSSDKTEGRAGCVGRLAGAEAVEDRSRVGLLSHRAYELNSR
jgi:hypothetical protein